MLYAEDTGIRSEIPAEFDAWKKKAIFFFFFLLKRKRVKTRMVVFLISEGEKNSLSLLISSEHQVSVVSE